LSRRVLISTKLFQLPERLLEALRVRRDRFGSDDLAQAYDAFLLDPGLGPPVYLTSDGRIVWDDDIWDVVGTRADAFAAVAAGIQKTGLSELRQLLPSRPTLSTDCPDCSATGRFDAQGQLKDLEGRSFTVVCMKCAGLGWTAPSLVLSESVLEAG